MTGGFQNNLRSTTCRWRYREILMRYCANELPEAAKIDFEDHLKQCAFCRSEYQEQIFANQLLSTFQLPEPPAQPLSDWLITATSSTTLPPTLSNRRYQLKQWLTAAAALLIALLFVLFLSRKNEPAYYQIVRLTGTPTIDTRSISQQREWQIGQLLATDRNSRALINVNGIGHVEVDANSQLRLLSAQKSEHRLALERGRIYATINAPPRLFFVETPAALAIDLGCAYTLTVDDLKETTLRVNAGWVALKQGERESWVPNGAICHAKPGQGPGTPHLESASENFRKNLYDFDFNNGGSIALSQVLTEARNADALTLWHLLPRLTITQREQVYDRLTALLPVPDGVTREQVLRLDNQALMLWRERVENASVGITIAPSTTRGKLTPLAANIEPRFNHTATRLNNNRVLIAGGRANQGVILASAEIYDPTTRSFTAAGKLKIARVGHTSTLLSNGKVLITGGSDTDFFRGSLDSAELYDPATNQFTLIGNMKERRLAHRATLLNDGRVLLSGGQGLDHDNLRSAEIYDPINNSFTAITDMIEPRADHTATLLNDGSVLIAGGAGGRYNPVNVTDTTELFIPAENRFISAGKMTMPRQKHSATLLKDNRVLIVGGSDARFYQGSYSSAEIYDPTSRQFSTTKGMQTARYKIRDAVVTLPDGRVLVAGGGGRLEIYDPVDQIFAVVPGGVGAAKFYASATVLANGDVLIVGGYSGQWTNDSLSNTSVWLYED